jgi:HAD superfamily hydrolase (TIGR01484 family)
MHYLALAADYDGTLATHGRVDESTVEALRRLRSSGRKLLLVTGRELNELLELFLNAELFDWIVAENGALLYRPEVRRERLLAEPPPEEFVTALKQRGVEPISVGRVIVATWEPHGTAVLDVIRELGLPLHMILNKRAVMVLPSGVDKATGLTAALAALGISPRSVVAVGDAENDHAFLELCGCAVAVANALPGLKQRADLVTSASRGAGVVELIGKLLADDLPGVKLDAPL